MKESRSIDSEFRVAPESRKIEGMAILFNVLSEDLGGFREIIVPEAVNGVIEKSDIIANYQHDEDMILARSTNGKGTLSLNITPIGLKYSFEAPKTSLGDILIESIRRGDIRNSSFAFTVSDSGQKWNKNSDGTFTRVITQFDKLFDVAAVARPAYSEASVALRKLEEVKNNEIDMNKRDTNILVNIEIEKEEVCEDEPVSPEMPMEPTEPCCPDCGEPCDTTYCPDCGTLVNPPSDPMMDPTEQDANETVDVMYDGQTYTIPKSVIDNCIKQENSQEMDQYFAALEADVETLKKKC